MARVVAVAFLIFSLWPGLAAAERLALVIGINDYDAVPSLTKAVGDAEAMTEQLGQMGFAVTTVINPDRRAFNQAITAFRRQLRPGDTAFVHFSGHGVEVNGRNLLLPRDIPVPTSGEEDFLIEEAIDLAVLIERISDSGAGVRIFVVDACRNNPFTDANGRAIGQLNGLALVEPPRGSFVLYSAGYRQTALDRLGPDDDNATSVYTRVLLEALKAPGVPISDIARSVRLDVAALAATVGHEQFPAYYDELTEDVVLRTEPEPVVETAENEASAAFDRAQSLGTPAAWNAFLKHFPEGVFADLARAALADMAVEAATQPPAVDVDLAVNEQDARNQLQELWSQGGTLAAAGNDAEYFRAMATALNLASARFGIDSTEYAQANNHMVGAWTAVGRLNEAIAAGREAIRVNTALFGARDLSVLNDKAGLAARLNATGHTEDAEALYAEILPIFEAILPPSGNRAAYAHALEGYSQVKATKGDIEAALQLARAAVEIMEAPGAQASLNYGWIARSYADILFGDGQCAEAMAVYAKAASGMKAANVAETQRDYAHILRRVGRGC